MERYTDEVVDRELSRALMLWRTTGKEEKYARAILAEWKKRFYRQYFQTWDWTDAAVFRHNEAFKLERSANQE